MPNPKRIAVFGASGLTGQALIAAALSKKVEVKALCRPGSEPPQAPGLTVITGQLSSPKVVRSVLEGAQAAACVLGPRSPYRDVFCAQATAAIIEQMKELGIKRFVCQTGAMIGNSNPRQTWVVELMTRFFQRQRPEVAKDRAEQERIVMESGLDWLIVKPPRIRKGKAGVSLRTGSNLRISLLSSIVVDELAAFLLGELIDGKRHRERFFVVGE